MNHAPTTTITTIFKKKYLFIIGMVLLFFIVSVTQPEPKHAADTTKLTSNDPSFPLPCNSPSCQITIIPGSAPGAQPYNDPSAYTASEYSDSATNYSSPVPTPTTQKRNQPKHRVIVVTDEPPQSPQPEPAPAPPSPTDVPPSPPEPAPPDGGSQ